MLQDKLRVFLLPVFPYLKVMSHGTIRNEDF